MADLRPLFKKTTIDDYKNAVTKVTDWLNSQITQEEVGLHWQGENGELGIYDGTSGIIKYYLELANYTREDKYLDIAKSAGDYIINQLEDTDLTEEKPGIAGLVFPKAQWAYNTGYTGIAHILIEITKHTGDQKYADFARSITDKLLEEAQEDSNGYYWTNETGILADGGIVLYLIEAANYFENDKYKDYAIKAGRKILSTKEVVSSDKIKFHPLDQKVLSDFVPDFDPSLSYEWPNFEYGTAGISYILARLYKFSGKEDFLDGAVKGASYVHSIQTNISDQAALVPYRFPDLADTYYLGYCHGPVGTYRVFWELYDITGEEKYIDQVKKLARGITSTQAPHLHSDGYWHFYGVCCGTASFIEIFTASDKHSNSDEFKEYAKASADKILSEASVDDDGAYWIHAWTRTLPDEYSTGPSYFTGQAGIADSLLSYIKYLEGNSDKIRFADDVL